MGRQLENSCKKREINGDFITHKSTYAASRLNCSENDNMAHEILKGRLKKVETVTVEVSTEDHTSQYLEIVAGNIKEKPESPMAKYEPSKVTVARPINLALSIPCNSKKGNYLDKKELYIEANISSIDINSMKNQKKKLKDNEALTIEDRDILELDIVVKPPVT